MTEASESASCSAVRLVLPLLLSVFLAWSSHSRLRMSARSASTCAPQESPFQQIFDEHLSVHVA